MEREGPPADDRPSHNFAAARTTRTKRQGSWSIFSGPCLTGRGTLGKCTSFRSCYPYIKLPDFQYWDTWVVGMYDACTYLTHEHRQVNGRHILENNNIFISQHSSFEKFSTREMSHKDKIQIYVYIYIQAIDDDYIVLLSLVLLYNAIYSLLVAALISCRPSFRSSTRTF